MAPIPQPDEHDKGPEKSLDNEPIDEMETPDLIINNEESSDSEGIDDDSVNNLGYQMLPQDIDDEDDENDNNDLNVEQTENDSTSNPGRLSYDDVPPVETDSTLHNGLHTAGGRVPSYMKVPDMPRPDPQDLLWNQTSSKKDTSMDTEQADKIKQTMSKFLLPKINIPDWAKGVSDDQLKEKLMKLQNKKT